MKFKICFYVQKRRILFVDDSYNSSISIGKRKSKSIVIGQQLIFGCYSINPNLLPSLFARATTRKNSISSSGGTDNFALYSRPCGFVNVVCVNDP